MSLTGDYLWGEIDKPGCGRAHQPVRFSVRFKPKFYPASNTSAASSHFLALFGVHPMRCPRRVETLLSQVLDAQSSYLHFAPFPVGGKGWDPQTKRQRHAGSVAESAPKLLGLPM